MLRSKTTITNAGFFYLQSQCFLIPSLLHTLNPSSYSYITVNRFEGINSDDARKKISVQLFHLNEASSIYSFYQTFRIHQPICGLLIRVLQLIRSYAHMSMRPSYSTIVLWWLHMIWYHLFYLKSYILLWFKCYNINFKRGKCVFSYSC